MSSSSLKRQEQVTPSHLDSDILKPFEAAGSSQRWSRATPLLLDSQQYSLLGKPLPRLIILTFTSPKAFFEEHVLIEHVLGNL